MPRRVFPLYVREAVRRRRDVGFDECGGAQQNEYFIIIFRRINYYNYFVQIESNT